MYHTLIKKLKNVGIEFEEGLTIDEIAQIEEIYDIKFPKSLKDFFTEALPVFFEYPHPLPSENDSSESEILEIKKRINFPIWNDFSESNILRIKERINFPIKGVMEDVISGYWLDSWGERPNNAEEIKKISLFHMNKAPKLIPIYSHRYIAQIDGIEDPPIISVMQTDIIYYGNNLFDYFKREFLRDTSAKLERPVSIPVWGDIM